MDTPLIVKMSLYNYHRPIVSNPRGCLKFSEQDKRDMVWLINQGWHPLDVAVAFGVSICRDKNGYDRSSIYCNYERWSAKFEKEH